MVFRAHRRRIDLAREALSAAFGVDPSHVRLVVDHSTGPTPLLVMIDASPCGRFVGNYDAIMTKRDTDPRFFTLQLEAETIDLFAAATEGAYRAMVTDAAQRGEVLPDSLALSQVRNEPWCSTYAMGEQLNDDGRVKVLSVCGHDVTTGWFPTDRGGRAFRVRATVTIGELEPAVAVERAAGPVSVE